MTKVVERFIKYAKNNTKSCPESDTTPSTKVQYAFAKLIADELKEIGLKNVSLDENGYVMAEVPSNVANDTKVVGFISHMDTSPDASGENVNPVFVENYDGKDIILNKKENVVLSPAEFPELKDYIGKTLITTNGTTLLGADDKAGVSEIVTAAEYLINHPEIKHGTIKIGFTPDEEIGRGADKFDVKKFGADFAYTVDGGPVGELQYENFNAAELKLTIYGRNVHPGSAKNKMINSMLIANEFISNIPSNEIPEKTEGYEGFYHLCSISGDVEKTSIEYIIRDFDKDNFEKRKEYVKSLGEKLSKKYGKERIELKLRDEYYNMKEKIKDAEYVFNIARDSMTQVGIEPVIVPVRGGTDGARLSYMGLPTPNLFTGGMNYHGKYEYIPTFTLDRAVDVIVKISENVGKLNK